jgi:uroporphyrinogen-III synthase
MPRASLKSPALGDSSLRIANMREVMPARRRHVLSPLPLAGATVVVTRPSASSAPMKRRIAALGGRALGLPGTRVWPADDALAVRHALRAARTADVVIFVSPNAVRHAFSILSDLRFARSSRICAVGAGTARALQRRGIRDVLWPRSRQDSEGLLALPELAMVRGLRVVLVDAPQGRDLLPRGLRTRGAAVEHIPVYRRGGARLDRRHFVALAEAAAPLFVQLSSAESLVHLHERLPAALFEKLVRAEAIASSQRIATAARALGWRRVHIAASAGPVAMLAATTIAVARHRL